MKRNFPTKSKIWWKVWRPESSVYFHLNHQIKPVVPPEVPLLAKLNADCTKTFFFSQLKIVPNRIKYLKNGSLLEDFKAFNTQFWVIIIFPHTRIAANWHWQRPCKCNFKVNSKVFEPKFYFRISLIDLLQTHFLKWSWLVDL